MIRKHQPQPRGNRIYWPPPYSGRESSNPRGCAKTPEGTAIVLIPTPVSDAEISVRGQWVESVRVRRLDVRWTNRGPSSRHVDAKPASLDLPTAVGRRHFLRRMRVMRSDAKTPSTVMASAERHVPTIIHIMLRVGCYQQNMMAS